MTDKTKVTGTKFEKAAQSGGVTGVVDPAGRLSTLTYDGNDKLNKYIDSHGRESVFTVTDGKLTKVECPKLC